MKQLKPNCLFGQSNPGRSTLSQTVVDPDLISTPEANSHEFGSSFSRFLEKSKHRVLVIESGFTDPLSLDQKGDRSKTMKHFKDLNRRDKELILGNFVVWGSIATALILAISLASDNAAEIDLRGGPVSGVISTGSPTASADV